METKAQTMDRFFIKVMPGWNSFSLCDTGLSKINFISQFLYRDSLVYFVRLQPCVEF